ncbi:MAG: glycogen synthase [Gemmatimonadetes bacterium]|nr:glycogen synthase [Gemmatimonadota bacterium]
MTRRTRDRSTTKPTPTKASKASAQPAVALATSSGAPISVVHATAELAPFARTGGLGEAVRTLARFQAKAGIDVTIVMPYYGDVARKAPPVTPLGPPLQVPVGGRSEEVTLLELVRPVGPPSPRVIFVASPTYFGRDGIYGDAQGEFRDNARRYACFSLAVIEALPRISDGPVVVHAHDWHAALVPVYLRGLLAHDTRYARVGAVLSVHNAGFQGHYPAATMADLGLPWSLYTLHHLEWYGRMNLLKGGMSLADAVVTVSPTHADELRTEAGGFGLHDAFRELGARFIGIVNGIDQEEWDPATDTQIAARFSRDDLSGKAACKASLQRLFGLPKRARTPLVGMSARMVYQKGLDLIFGSGFLTLDAQFVFLGAGEERYERALLDLARRAPDRLGVQLNFTDRLEHRLLAGADLCLMPSMYEPCGLTQMRAQRYGALPLARRVGGLADTIEDGVTGFLFDEYTSDDFLHGTARAVLAYRDAATFARMQREAMGRDFGWEHAEARYRDVYRFAAARRGA